MKRPDDPEVLAWLEKADGDLVMADRAMQPGLELPDQACYHSQQAAEKYFKALLIALELDVPRTHDLVVLVHTLAPHFPEIAHFIETAGELTKYATAPRYPSFLAPETEEDAGRSITLASSIRSCARRLLTTADK